MARNIKLIVPVLAISGMLCFTACKQDQPKAYDHLLKYTETQCSDPWEHDQDPAVHKANIHSYLLTHGIESENIDIHIYDAGFVCAACNCESGSRVELYVESDDVAAALTLGFYE